MKNKRTILIETIDGVQLRLPVGIGVYECLDGSCFYRGTILDIHEVTWKYEWCHSVHDLELVALCPACHGRCGRLTEGGSDRGKGSKDAASTPVHVKKT